MNCKICKQEAKEIFTTKVMNKHNASYFQCGNCKFIQTEEPFWLEEAYNDAITSLDLGYISRNILYSQVASSLIKFSFNKSKKFIDYGGGYGMFVRMMRDTGFDFYRQDLYCENLFADHFDITDLKNRNAEKFELLSSFEVFEHLEEPLEEIEKMFAYSDSILFSTELQPETEIKGPSDWAYILPEIGQHIALFSKGSFKELERIFNCKIYSNGSSLHLMTKKRFKINPVKYTHYKHVILDKLLRRNYSNSRSLLQQDFDTVMNKINSSSKKSI